MNRIQVGDGARFYPENLDMAIVDARVEEIEIVDSPELTEPYLASLYGGDIAVRPESDGKLLTESAVFKVRLGLLDSVVKPHQILRGDLLIDAESRSLAGALWRQITQVLVRESGF